MPNVGKMVIELHKDGPGKPTMDITFDPVGMFTPGLIGDSQAQIATAILTAQAGVRHETITGSKKGIAR